MNATVPPSRLPNRLRVLRTEAGLTQDQLGRQMGTTGQTIARLETGRRKLTQDWIERASGVLGCSAGDFFWPSDGDSVQRPATPPAHGFGDRPAYGAPDQHTTIPVFETTESADDLIIHKKSVDRIWSPPFLKTVVGAFAFYMRGLSAAPTYEAGDLLMVNPVQSVRIGDHALILGSDLTDGSALSKLGELVSIEQTIWRVRSFNPYKEIKLPKDNWPVAWKICVKVRS